MRTLTFCTWLLVASSLVTTTDAAAALCEGICEIDLYSNCLDAVQTLVFAGDCCSLKEVEGKCYMVTTKNCRYKQKDSPDMNCMTDEQGNPGPCLPSYTIYFATSEEPCPESQFDVPVWLTDAPITFAPTSSPAPTFAPTSSPAPTVAPDTVIPSTGMSFATMEIVDGSPPDCYSVERYIESATSSSNGCSDTLLKLTYYNGGTNGDYIDTGFPQENYLQVEVEVMHDCKDAAANPNHCSVKVDDLEGGIYTCEHCSYQDGNVTVECSAAGGIFAMLGSDTIALFAAVDLPYSEKFFLLMYDEAYCQHPSLNSVIPSISVVPASTSPSIVPASITPSIVPSGPGPSYIPFSVAPSGAGPSSEPGSVTPSIVPYSETPSQVGTSSVPGSVTPSGPGPTYIPYSETPSQVGTSSVPGSITPSGHGPTYIPYSETPSQVGPSSVPGSITPSIVPYSETPSQVGPSSAPGSVTPSIVPYSETPSQVGTSSVPGSITPSGPGPTYIPYSETPSQVGPSSVPGSITPSIVPYSEAPSQVGPSSVPGSITPSIVPYSETPSQVGTSSVPGSVTPSGHGPTYIPYSETPSQVGPSSVPGSITPSIVPYSETPSQVGPSSVPGSVTPSGSGPTYIPDSETPSQLGPSSVPGSVTPSGPGPTYIPYSETPSQVGPSSVPGSITPSIISSDSPSGLSVLYSSATMDIKASDCYNVERMSYDTVWSNDCRDKGMDFTYYNGGLNPDYVDTGHDKEVYFNIKVSPRVCPNDAVTNCDITVNQFPGMKCKCSYVNDLITMDMEDCTAMFPTVFVDTGRSHSVLHFYDGGPTGGSDQWFFPIKCDKCCSHPALGASYPSWVPISDVPSFTGPLSSTPSGAGPSYIPFSVAPSGAGPSTVPGSISPSWIPSGPFPSYEPFSDTPSGAGPSVVPYSDAPSAYFSEICEIPADMPVSALIEPGSPDPNAYKNLFHGDPSMGDCYSVETELGMLKVMGDEPIYCCNTITITYTYYNGGTDIYGQDSGTPYAKYREVQIAVTEDCGERDIPASCTISVDNLGSCSKCSYNDEVGEVTLVDCSNLGGVFPIAEQTITFNPISDDGASESRYSSFLSLAMEESRCMHPALSGPSSVPSVSDPSVSPTGNPLEPAACDVPADAGLSAVGLGTSPTTSFEDVLAGNTATGVCYNVKRQLSGLTQRSEADRDTYCCRIIGRKYVYYNADPDETYATVDISVELDCGGRGIPALCSIEVEEVGKCQCTYDEVSETVLLGDCGELEGFFASSTAEVSFTTNLNDDDDAFVLPFDEEHCNHPAWSPMLGSPSQVPSYTSVPISEAPSSTLVPNSQAPSYHETEEPPSMPPWPFDSDVPTSAPLPPTASTFECYEHRSNGIVEGNKCHAMNSYLCVEDFQDGCVSVTAYYDYYNQYTTAADSSWVGYYYITISSASGCNPLEIAGQPENGCSIEAAGEKCLQCSSDGDLISLVDCTNVQNVFFPPTDQTISLASGEEAFSVIETDDMCNHPAVTLSSDKAAPTDEIKAEQRATLPISVTLKYFFTPNKGAEPGGGDVALLVANTVDFFHSALLSDTKFTDILLDIKMLDIKDIYTAKMPDEFTLTLTADVVVEKVQGGPSSKDAAVIISKANLSGYLHQYVRKNRTGKRNLFFYVEKVIYKGATHAL